MKIYKRIVSLFKKPVASGIEFNPGEYSSLFDYYTKQYLTDLEEFKEVCKTGKELFFVQDLDLLNKSKYRLLKKKHFLYFLAIHTALLMEIHKTFPEKYEEFKKVNNGIVFEYGLTNTFMQPWDVLERLNVPFNQELFSSCVGWVMSQLMTDKYFCGIIPDNFMDKFINDPDLNNSKTSYGRKWKEICTKEWVEVITSICPKIK
jgi:hypothetical protein